MKLGVVLLLGGILGSTIGVETVAILRRVGQFDLFISLSYVAFLGIIGTLMLIESINTMREVKAGKPGSARRSGQHSWVHGLPLKIRFNRSKLYISAIPPFLIGAFVGFLAAIMGVGGGFIMVPAMIYLLRVPTNIVVGTSLFQIVFVTAATTVLHATQNHTVDILLPAADGRRRRRRAVRGRGRREAQGRAAALPARRARAARLPAARLRARGAAVRPLFHRAGLGGP